MNTSMTPPFRLKKLSDQTLVIMGATSGIGLATATIASQKGAKLLLTSRDEDELKSLAEGIRAQGGYAAYKVMTLTDKDSVQSIANLAIQQFGGFDTWVNCSGQFISGKLTEMHIEEKRRLFEINFWGLVHGCRAALPHLRIHGGALVNVGSPASDRVYPWQGIFAASQHAAKAYTEALRMEMQEEEAPIFVSWVNPTAIDIAETPLPYAPETVATAVLAHATQPIRLAA